MGKGRWVVSFLIVLLLSPRVLARVSYGFIEVTATVWCVRRSFGTVWFFTH